MKHYLTIDVGGTFIKYGIVKGEGELVYQDKLPTPQEKMDDFTATLLSIYQEMAVKADLAGIALSCPGKVDSRAGYLYYGGALLYLKDFPLAEFLSEATGLPVTVVNDGKAAALAENWLGNLADVENGLALILGTGLGGGIILQNQVLLGSHFQAGEFSFLLPTREFSDVSHIAGLQGSAVEMVASIATALGLPDKQDGRAVFSYIEQKNEQALTIFEDYCQKIAHTIYNVQAIVDVERVVIGGGISAQSILVKEIQRQYKHILDTLPLIGPMITPVDIQLCHFRENANLVGAYYYHLTSRGEE
ncbi:ROK protein [Streptococcus pneumoniae]|nr:ROK protein [Streptococcus pneumoniae]